MVNSTVAESRSNGKSSPAREIYSDAVFIPLYPELAAQVGVLESLLIMQIDYWIANWPHFTALHGGQSWLKLSTYEIHEHGFQFVTPQGISKAINRLVARGLVVEHRKSKGRLIRINHAALKNLRSKTELSVEEKPPETPASKVNNPVASPAQPIENPVVKSDNPVVNSAGSVLIYKEERENPKLDKKEGESSKRLKAEEKGDDYRATFWEMFSVLEEVCEIRGELAGNARKIQQTAHRLIAAGFTPEQVQAFPTWWKKEDWRGKKGDVPRLREIEETIQRAANHAEKADIERFRYASYMADPDCPHCRGNGWHRVAGQIETCDCTVKNMLTA